jgi:hypothetical protein
MSTTITTPHVVRVQLKKYFKNYDKEYAEMNHVFRILYTSDINIYVVKYHSSSTIHYYFFFYDNVRQKITSNPYRINGKWSNNNEAGFSRKLLMPPLAIVDTGQNHIVFKERLHNGTSYNAVISHYVMFDKKRLNPYLCFCVENSYLYVSPEINNLDYYEIRRKYCNNLVTCTLFIDTPNGQQEQEIGHFEIDTKSNVISNKFITNTLYEDFLVTGSGLPENYFLKHGYLFEY